MLENNKCARVSLALISRVEQPCDVNEMSIMSFFISLLQVEHVVINAQMPKQVLNMNLTPSGNENKFFKNLNVSLKRR